MLTSVHNKSRSSTIFLTKTQLIKVKDDIFIKKDRKKAISERISPRQKQLKEDFAMFQFLKTERDNLFQTQQVKQNPKKITSPNNQRKKSFIEMKMERYQQQVQETFNKRKQDLLLKQKLNLEQDLQDLKKITQKGQIEFFNKVGLYSKYYSQELINPQSYRQEDLNLPIYRQTNIENNNSFRKILIKPQINARLNESPEIQMYDVKIIQNDTQNLQQQRQQIQRSVHHKEDPFFEYVKENDILRVKSLLSIDQSYVNLRTKLNETPLHIAAKKNLIEIVEILLNYKADEKAKDMFGRTPRQSASLSKSFNVLKSALLNIVQGTPILDLQLDGIETRKNTRFQDKQNGLIKLPVYQGEDDISGVVDVKMNKTKKVEHTGIRIELIGRIEIINDQKQSSDFMSMARELEPQGILTEDKTFKFAFTKFEKQYESYYGNTVRLRYFLRVSMNRNYGSKVQKEVDFAVLIPQPEIEEGPQAPLKLEVGIEECLHIDFEYFKSKYHMRDVVTGKVNFYLVKIKIKYMELAVIRKEVIGQGQNQQTDNETLVKYELMDGCPTKGEVIPIRLYLAGVDMTPSQKNISGKFSLMKMIEDILNNKRLPYTGKNEIKSLRKKINKKKLYIYIKTDLMKYLILLSMIAISLCVNLSTQETLFNNALTEKLKGTSLGRAVLLLSQTKQQNFNPLFDALENLEKSLSTSLTDENTKFQTFTQQTDNDLAYYEELVKKYNNEVSEYQIDIRDFLKTRTDYELELDVKRKELQEAKLQKNSIEQQQSQDERGFKKQTDDLNSAILVLDEAIKLIEKARFSSFIESDAQELKILANRMKDQTLTKMLVEIATADYQNAETLRSTQRLLQNIRAEFQENVINLSSQADSSKNANEELIAQYDAKITQLSQEVIPQLQGDIQTKDGEISTKKDLLGESQANLAEAQERVKQLNHDLQSSTKTHQVLVGEYSSQLRIISECYEALNSNEIKRS